MLPQPHDIDGVWTLRGAYAGGGQGHRRRVRHEGHRRQGSKNGRLEIEDEQGNVSRGKDAVRELIQDWRLGGSLIPEESPRREVFNGDLGTVVRACATRECSPQLGQPVACRYR